MNEKAVLITGGAKRIGAETARTLHAAGMNIVIHYRSSRQEADELKAKGLAEIEQEKSRVLSEIRTDVIELSVEIAREIIEKTVDKNIAEELTDNAIKKIDGVSFQ